MRAVSRLSRIIARAKTRRRPSRPGLGPTALRPSSTVAGHLCLLPSRHVTVLSPRARRRYVYKRDGVDLRGRRYAAPARAN